jgi:hypothetical protein
MRKLEIKKYKHNDLFRPGLSSAHNACVGTNGGPYDERDYAYGYFEAAERLAKAILADTSLIDLMIYPLAFTNRHAIELALKDLAHKLPPLWNEGPAVALTHKLSDNWRQVKSYLEKGPEFDPTAVEMVDAVLRDFIEIDPSGEAFRFPSSRSGSKFLQDSAWLNVQIFEEKMKSVRECFEFWFEVCDALWENKMESVREAESVARLGW